MKPSTMGLIGPITSRNEIRKIYNKVYQLKRAPGVNPCDMETVGNICQEILDSIKEYLCHREDHAQPTEEPGQRSTSTSRPDPQSNYQQGVCVTYDHFRDLKEGSCEQAMAVAWDAHRQALVATALLKDKIKRLSHSLSHSCQWSGSHRQSSSHQRRSRAEAQCSRESSTSSHHVSRRPQSQSPSHLRWQVTFEDSPSVGADDSWLLSWVDKMARGVQSNWSQPEPRIRSSHPS